MQAQKDLAEQVQEIILAEAQKLADATPIFWTGSSVVFPTPEAQANAASILDKYRIYLAGNEQDTSKYAGEVRLVESLDPNGSQKLTPYVVLNDPLLEVRAKQYVDNHFPTSSPEAKDKFVNEFVSLMGEKSNLSLSMSQVISSYEISTATGKNISLNSDQIAKLYQYKVLGTLPLKDLLKDLPPELADGEGNLTVPSGELDKFSTIVGKLMEEHGFSASIEGIASAKGFGLDPSGNLLEYLLRGEFAQYLAETLKVLELEIPELHEVTIPIPGLPLNKVQVAVLPSGANDSPALVSPSAHRDPTRRYASNDAVTVSPLPADVGLRLTKPASTAARTTAALNRHTM